MRAIGIAKEKFHLLPVRFPLIFGLALLEYLLAALLAILLRHQCGSSIVSNIRVERAGRTWWKAQSGLASGAGTDPRRQPEAVRRAGIIAKYLNSAVYRNYRIYLRRLCLTIFLTRNGGGRVGFGPNSSIRLAGNGKRGPSSLEVNSYGRPDFQSLMLPVLRFVSGGKDHYTAEMRERIGSDLKLTPDELAEKLKSGNAGLFANRLARAVAKLRRPRS
jgi:hypothetical protein